jgi:hypothetical protein
MVARKAAAAEPAKRTRPAALDASGLEVGEVQNAPAAFARGGLDADHPLAQAFLQSVSDNVAKRISVSDPELAEKLIRKFAANHDLGVRVLKDADSITIKGGQKKQFPGRNKDEVAVADPGGDETNFVPSQAVPPSADEFLGSDEER